MINFRVTPSGPGSWAAAALRRSPPGPSLSSIVRRGRIAVFSIRVLRDERICVIAEQRPDCSEEESFQWMSRVLQAVDSIHQVGIYCLALVPPNSLPKTPLGGIHLSETRRRFMEGSLHPANVLMCPHTCVTNLPKPREVHQGNFPILFYLPS